MLCLGNTFAENADAKFRSRTQRFQKFLDWLGTQSWFRAGQSLYLLQEVHREHQLCRTESSSVPHVQQLRVVCLRVHSQQKHQHHANHRRRRNRRRRIYLRREELLEQPELCLRLQLGVWRLEYRGRCLGL